MKQLSHFVLFVAITTLAIPLNTKSVEPATETGKILFFYNKNFFHEAEVLQWTTKSKLDERPKKLEVKPIAGSELGFQIYEDGKLKEIVKGNWMIRELNYKTEP